MISQMVYFVNKAPSFHWLEGLKFAIEQYPKEMFHVVLFSLADIGLSLLLWFILKDTLKDGLVLLVCSFCSVVLMLSAIIMPILTVYGVAPFPIFEKSEFRSQIIKVREESNQSYNCYVVKSDTKSMNKIKNSQTTLYYDKQHHVLNEFPDKLTVKDKNEAIVNNEKIKSLVLNGSKEQALDTLIDASILKKMDKILAVSTAGDKTTIKYVEK